MSPSNRKNIRVLRGITVLTGLVALVLGVCLTASVVTKKMSNSAGVSESAASQVSIATLAPTTVSEDNYVAPTPTPIVINELLETDPIVEEFFGPLPEVTQTTEVRRNVVHGLYVSYGVNLENNLNLIDNSELNSIVIDLKESWGIYFNTTNEFAADVGYINPKYDLKAICDECHSRDIWVIGRIVCFKDPLLAKAYPDRAICDEDGNTLFFTTEGSECFANPYDTRNWDYLIDIALEAISIGVDEIQFDYIRFPTGSTTTGAEPYFGEGEIPTKAQVINRFLQTARRRIQDTYGVPVSADIFGIAVTSSLDGQILGQDWATVGFTGVDSLCPMLYPSHYALGTILNGHEFEFPDKEPYDVLYNAMIVGGACHNQEGYSTVRPYLQAFTAAYIGAGRYMEYDYEAINDEIRAIQDSGSGSSEWVLWNVEGIYPEGNYGGNAG